MILLLASPCFGLFEKKYFISNYFITQNLTSNTSSSTVNSYWNASGANIYNTNSGFVGIGTSAPLTKLDVRQNTTRLTASFLYPNLPNFNSTSIIVGKSNTTANAIEITYVENPADANTFGCIGIVGDNVGGGTGLCTRKGGSVGIGTTLPSQTFEVAGTSKIRNVIINGSVLALNGINKLWTPIDGMFWSPKDNAYSLNVSSRKAYMPSQYASLDWGLGLLMSGSASTVLNWFAQTIYGSWIFSMANADSLTVDNTDGYPDVKIRTSEGHFMMTNNGDCTTSGSSTPNCTFISEGNPMTQIDQDLTTGTTYVRNAPANSSTCSGTYDCSSKTPYVDCSTGHEGICSEEYASCGGADYYCIDIGIESCASYAAYGCSVGNYCGGFYGCSGLDETACNAHSAGCTWFDGNCYGDGDCSSFDTSTCEAMSDIGCGTYQQCDGSGTCGSLNQTGCESFPIYCTPNYNCVGTGSCALMDYGTCSASFDIGCNWLVAAPSWKTMKFNSQGTLTVNVDETVQCSINDVDNSAAQTCTDGSYIETHLDNSSIVSVPGIYQINKTGNMNLEGNQSVDYVNNNGAYHAGMYLSSLTGISDYLNGTLRKTNFTTSIHHDGFLFVNNDTLRLTDANGKGHYQAQWKYDADGTNNHVYIGYVYVNEVQQNSTFDHKIGQASNEFTLYGFGYIDINNVGDNVTVRIADLTSASTPTVYVKNIDIVRLHYE